VTFSQHLDASMLLDVSRRSILILCACSIACSRTPSAPDVPSTGVEQITGRESIGWDQRAIDPVELATYRYAVYVDGTRAELSGVSCASTPSGAGYACSARLPPLSSGRHAIQLAAFIVAGSILESGRSGTLEVNVSAATAPSSVGGVASKRPEWRTDPVVTSDGVEMRIETVLRELERPTGLAFMPDGRIAVAEQAGSIRVAAANGVVSGGSRIEDVDVRSGGLLAVALDPQFVLNHFAYIVYAARPRDDSAVIRLARVREAAGTFADRVVLYDQPLDGAEATAGLSVGPDGKLYVAAGGDVLRLNRDGTTPDDQPGYTPVYSSGYRAARGLSWQAESGLLWVLDSADPAIARVMAAGRPQTARALPQSTPPSSIAFGTDAMAAFRNDLIIGSDEGRHLLRVRFDPHAPTTIAGTERLLQDAVGGIRVVAPGPDGALYFATADAVGRLVARPR
jgi:glucose/arabinose dehydrogenase